MAVNYGVDSGQVAAWLEWCLEFQTHQICMRLDMAKEIFNINSNDQIVIDATSLLYQKYETFGKNADMIYLHLNSERASALRYKLAEAPMRKVRDIIDDNVPHELSMMDLKWETSYHYKNKEEQSAFLHNATEKLVANQISKSLGLKKIGVKTGFGDSMENSIYRCLEKHDFKVCPFVAEQKKGVLIQEMRGCLSRQLANVLEGDNILLHPYLMEMDKNDLRLEQVSFSKLPARKDEPKWHPLQYWATELFAEICKCNIMIVDVRKSIHCSDHLLAPPSVTKRGSRSSKSKQQTTTIEQEDPPTMWEYAVRCASERAFDPTNKPTIYIRYDNEENHYSPLVRPLSS
jgi:hypothetical protein